MQEVHRKVDKKIECLQSAIWQRDKVYIAEKAKFAEESKRLSRIAYRVTWDVASKAFQMHSQLHSIKGKISALESLLMFGEVRLGLATRMMQLQNELYRA